MKMGALIPIRLASERLPNKALMDINGRKAIEHLLDRAFASKYLEPSNVIICTTTKSSDDPLVNLVTQRGANIFRGSETDIIDRFWCATREFGFDAFIQIDGDDICADTYYMDLCMKTLCENEEYDIVYCEGLPLGLGTKAIKTSALERVWKHHITDENDTGFIYYFTKTDLCNKKSIGPQKPNHINEKVRLLWIMKKIFNFLEPYLLTYIIQPEFLVLKI